MQPALHGNVIFHNAANRTVFLNITRKKQFCFEVRHVIKQHMVNGNRNTILYAVSDGQTTGDQLFMSRRVYGRQQTVQRHGYYGASGKLGRPSSSHC